MDAAFHAGIRAQGGLHSLPQCRRVAFAQRVFDGETDLRHRRAQLMGHVAREPALPLERLVRTLQCIPHRARVRLHLTRQMVDVKLGRLVGRHRRQPTSLFRHRAERMPYQQEAHGHGQQDGKHNAARHDPVHPSFGTVPAFALGCQHQPSVCR